MKTFNFVGTLRKSRVQFQIDAKDLDEARNFALRGQFDGFDDMNAKLDDWTIDPWTAELEDELPTAEDVKGILSRP